MMDLIGVKAAIREVAARGIDCIVVGTAAAMLQGARLAAGDLDLCIATDDANLERAGRLLRELRAVLLREPLRGLSAVDITEWKSLRLGDACEHHLFRTPLGELDFLPSIFGVEGWIRRQDYAELSRTAIGIELGKSRVLAMPLAEIARSKRALGRDQDLAALPEIERAIAAARGD